MDDLIRFVCPYCRNPLRVPANLAGTAVGCAYCAAAVTVPHPPAVSYLPVAERDEPPRRQPPADPFRDIARPSRNRRDSDDDAPSRIRPRAGGGGNGVALAFALMLFAALVAVLVVILVRRGGPGEAESARATAAVGGFVCLGLLFYFIPTIVAVMRGHPNTPSIVVVNFFLGWSLVGFVVALAWAFTNNAPQQHIHRHYH